MKLPELHELKLGGADYPRLYRYANEILITESQYERARLCVSAIPENIANPHEWIMALQLSHAILSKAVADEDSRIALDDVDDAARITDRIRVLESDSSNKGICLKPHSSGGNHERD